MKKYLAKMLRRVAQRLDPAPVPPTFRLFEPNTMGTTATTFDFKLVQR